MFSEKGAQRCEYEEPKVLVVITEYADIITSSGNNWSGEWDFDF